MIIIGFISEMNFSLNKILPVSVPEADFSFPIAFGLSATCTPNSRGVYWNRCTSSRIGTRTVAQVPGSTVCFGENTRIPCAIGYILGAASATRCLAASYGCQGNRARRKGLLMAQLDVAGGRGCCCGIICGIGCRI